MERLMAGLDPREERLARAVRAGPRRRHFVLGRLAGRAALRRVLGAYGPTLAILVGPHREPVVELVQESLEVGVSLSHSGRVAVACAWSGSGSRGAGVDVERSRPTDVARSAYAFTRRERAVLNGTGRSSAGLLAWAAKEATWKALQPAPDMGPEELALVSLAPDEGWAEVRASRRLAPGPGSRSFRVALRDHEGPDGRYVVAVAEHTSRGLRV